MAAHPQISVSSHDGRGAPGARQEEDQRERPLSASQRSPSSQRSWQQRGLNSEFEPLNIASEETDSPKMSPISSASPSRKGSKGSRISRTKRTWRNDEAEITSVASSDSRRVILQKRSSEILEEEDPRAIPIEEPVFEQLPPVTRVEERPPRALEAVGIPVEHHPSPAPAPVVAESTPTPLCRSETPPPPIWEVAPEDPSWPNPSREDVAYEAVHAKCGERPLELAALAKLKAWDKGPGAVYSLEETMDLVRWLEQQLEPPKGDLWHLWDAFCTLSRKRRVVVIVATLLAVVLLLVVIGFLTAAALAIQRVASIERSGIMTGPDGDAAGTALAVNAKSLLDYPNLALEDLRRAEDVVFLKDGAFHYYRLSKTTSVQGGAAVHLLGEDGTVIHVENGHVAVTPPFAKPGPIDSDGLSFLEGGRGGSSLASAGAFRAIVEDPQ